MIRRRDDIAVAGEVRAEMCRLPAMTSETVTEDDGWVGLIDRIGVSHRFLRRGREAGDQRESVLGGGVQVLASE
jgi:hypothetical protein